MSYEHMKAKQKNLIRERSYYTYLLTTLSSAFEWKVPKGVEPRYLEKFLHEGGYFAVQKTDEYGYLVVPTPSRAGKLDQYGDGIEVTGVTRGNGYQIKGTLGENVAICYNTIDREPDLDLIRYADAFSQVDKSIMANVRWSILAPLLCASNDKTMKVISKLVDDMLEGKMKCITSKDVLDSLQSGNGQGVYSIDITHPERIKNVQYQSELYDVLLRRFFNKYGLNVQNTSKHAQVTTDEVNAWDSVSWVYIINMLKERQKFCTEATRIWGDEWSVEFGEPWKTEYEKYMNSSNEEEPQEQEPEESGVDDNESMDKDK